VGHLQFSTASPPLLENSRFPPRVCLRKGCGRIFDVRSGNQRYCQDPECLRLVRRWQAAKRQRVRRQRPEVREERAAAAKEVRERKSRLKTDPPAPTDPVMPAEQPVMPAEQPDPPGAWSRSRKIPGPICDRVGCYESPRPACRCPASYCSQECRRAMQRVRDRERKWLWRNTLAGQIKCQLQAQRRQVARRASSADRDSEDTGEATTRGSDVVLPYRSPPIVSVPLGDRKEDISHDVQNPETPVASQSRPPPAS
jgi:hypothetical protein